MNFNWSVRVAVPPGSGEERLAVRCFTRNPDPARVTFQMRLHLAMEAACLPVPGVVSSFSGGPVTEFGGRRWAVYGWVDGDEHDYADLPQARAAFDLLAELHLGLAGAAIPGYVEPEGAWPYPAWVREGERLIRESLAGEWAAALGPHDKDVAISAQRRLAADLPAEDYELLPKQYVWGDFHGRNMKFRGTTVTGIFDLDVARWESPMFDLATGLYMFGRKGRGVPQIRLAVAKELVVAYTARRPISPAEARAVVPLLIFRYVTDVPRPYPLPLGVEPIQEVRKSLRILGAVLEAADALTGLLVAAADRG